MNKPPAFPTHVWDEEYERYFNTGGMTLRDYFAAKVMQGICASGPSMEWSSNRLAAEAYDLADAMMKAREQ